MAFPSFTSTLGEADLGFLQLGMVSGGATEFSETINAAMASFAATLGTGGSSYSATLTASMAAFAATLGTPSEQSVTLDQNMPLFRATLQTAISPRPPDHCEAVPVQEGSVPLAFIMEPDERAGS